MFDADAHATGDWFMLAIMLKDKFRLEEKT
jgi:hypothetical protein